MLHGVRLNAVLCSQVCGVNQQFLAHFLCAGGGDGESRCGRDVVLPNGPLPPSIEPEVPELQNTRWLTKPLLPSLLSGLYLTAVSPRRAVPCPQSTKLVYPCEGYWAISF
jgi:hypothetical protein